MNLREIQTGYLDLLKGRKNAGEITDEYFKKIAASDNFKVLNDIVIYWRAHGIKEYCTLTSGLLIKIDRFQDKVENFYREVNFSGYIEELGKAFLQYLTGDEDKLISFISGFELAMINVNLGSKEEFVIESCFNPDEVFNFILAEDKYPELSNTVYIIRVSEGLENFYSVEIKD